jgi:hypothetical protein
VAFSKGARFRVELYVDTGDKERNKRAFDDLRERAGEVERGVGESLSWERLDQARASRVACYREGTILDRSNHEALQEWAVEMLARFNEVVVPAALNALEDTRRA